MSALSDALADLKGHGLLDRVVSLKVTAESAELQMMPASPPPAPERETDGRDPLFDAS